MRIFSSQRIFLVSLKDIGVLKETSTGRVHISETEHISKRSHQKRIKSCKELKSSFESGVDELFSRTKSGNF